MAREWKCSFIEASAKTNLNITKIFETLVIEIEKSSGDGGAFQQQQKTASGSGGGVGRSSSSSAAAAASSAKGGSGQLVGPDGEKLKECIIL